MAAPSSSCRYPILRCTVSYGGFEPSPSMSMKNQQGTAFSSNASPLIRVTPHNTNMDIGLSSSISEPSTSIRRVVLTIHPTHRCRTNRIQFSILYGSYSQPRPAAGGCFAGSLPIFLFALHFNRSSWCIRSFSTTHAPPDLQRLAKQVTCLPRPPDSAGNWMRNANVGESSRTSLVILDEGPVATVDELVFGVAERGRVRARGSGQGPRRCRVRFLRD